MAENGCGTNPHPKVSVIMNCYNSAEFLPQALDSVYGQSYPNWEIVFWDNASTDNSAEIAQSYGGRVRYFRSDRTYYLSKARNLAFQQARGDYIGILDCDDIWLPSKLEKQVRLFEENSTLGMTYSDSIFFDDDGDKIRLFQCVSPQRGHIFGYLVKQNFISSETMMFSRRALEKLPYLFDEAFSIIMDYDLSLRLAYRFPSDYVEEPLSKWRMHGESGSYKKRFVIPHEHLHLLEKLALQIPDMQTRFSSELASTRKSLHYQFAMEKWARRNTLEAREELSPHLHDLKFFTAFLFTFLLSFRQYEQCKRALQQLQYKIKKAYG